MLHVRQANVARTLRVGSWSAGRDGPTVPAYPGPMSREIGSWLSGPQSLGSNDGFPGEHLGAPSDGPGSLAGMGRRAAALGVDWLISYGLAGLLLATGLVGTSFLATGVLLIWFVLGVVSVRLFGFTPGQYLLGLRVASVDNRLNVGTGRAIVRGLLIALVIPALFTDSDGRGFQDRLTATAVVRR
jgi:hypothetical protein